MSSAANLRLGNHLKRLREERKLTLGGVEALSGGYGERINKTYLFRVERGKTLPTLARLRILARVYRVHLSKLVEVLDSAFAEEENLREPLVALEGASFDELRDQGIDAEREGDFPRAIALYRLTYNRAVTEAPSNLRSKRVATARHDLAIALTKAGRLELAAEEAEAALECEAIDQDLLDKVRLNLATIYRRIGRIALSRDILFCLLARRDQMAPQVLVGAYSVAGSILLRSDPREASHRYRSALSAARQLKDPYLDCELLYNIGLAESRSGNFGRAIKVLQKSLEIARRKDFNLRTAKALAEIGKTYCLRRDFSQARSVLREAIEVARQRDYWEPLFISQYYLRRIALSEGHSASVKTMEASLKFFTTRLEESFDELEAFKEETK